jgi:hypothetical protein
VEQRPLGTARRGPDLAAVMDPDGTGRTVGAPVLTGDAVTACLAVEVDDSGEIRARHEYPQPSRTTPRTEVATPQATFATNVAKTGSTRPRSPSLSSPRGCRRSPFAQSCPPTPQEPPVTSLMPSLMHDPTALPTHRWDALDVFGFPVFARVPRPKDGTAICTRTSRPDRSSRRADTIFESVRTRRRHGT